MVGFAITSTGFHSLWFSLGRPVWQSTLLHSALFRCSTGDVLRIGGFLSRGKVGQWTLC